MKIIHENCDKDLANDTTLPNNAYVIHYRVGGVDCYDIAQGSKTVELFDHYYDKYKENFVTMYQAEGRVSPKLWGNEVKSKKKK